MEMLSSQSLDDGGDRGQKDWFRRAPCIPYLVVVSLSHPNGPQVIVGSMAKGIVWVFFCLARVLHHRGSRSGAPVVEIGKSRGHEGKGETGIGPR
jgi:hypothetical protein